MSISSTNLPKIEQVRQEKARRKVIDFTTYTKPDYDTNWHHHNLAHALDRMVSGDLKRLMVFMPPRHGKSELVSRRFPAFLLGKNPNLKIIGTSYSGSLASSMNRDVQRIIDSPEYQDLFPETSLNQSNVRSIAGNYLRNSDIFEVVGYEGSYMSAGVSGGITGRGADFAIIDDPIKNRQDADSQTIRDAVFDWFTSTLYTRLEKDARVLITLTRWHEDDLAGRLLEQSKNNPDADQWEIINYPAIYDDEIANVDETDPRNNGDALWEAKYDLNRLKAIKSTIGSYEWSALYQQIPSPPDGEFFKRKYWQYYKVCPELSEFDEIIQSWDMAFKDSAKNDNDYVVGQVWGRIGANKYLIDMVRERMGFPETLQAVRNMTARYPEAQAKLVEDKANGTAVIQTLQNEIHGIIPINPEGGKESRASSATVDVEAGNVYLPDPSLKPWVHDFVEEHSAFPNGSHDDMVDAHTQASNRFNNKAKPRVRML